MAPPVTIPLHRTDLGEREREAAAACLDDGRLGGDGPCCQRAEAMLAELTGARHVMLTPSATAALELALSALEIGPGDEVVLPSFCFPSAANAIMLRGAIPVFADLHEGSLLLDAEDVARVASPRTRAVLPVDYGSVACDVSALRAAAGGDHVLVIEDAAHGIDARRDGRHIGTSSDAAALSFHVTKNVTCGEGGALLISDDAAARRAEIIREKGTNRAGFLRGEVSRYEWIDVGTSGTMSDLLAAVLAVQLDRVGEFTRLRRAVAARYDEAFGDLYASGALRPQEIPAGCEPNGHLYAVRTRDSEAQAGLRRHLAERGIEASFHFVPLHTTDFASQRLGPQRSLPVTERCWATLLRLPIYPSLTEEEQGQVIDAVRHWHRG